MNTEKNAFLLCFSTIIWKRIFSCLVLYSEYKQIELSSDNVLKCFKYNLLAPSGFVEILKPYILKALNTGFLMPKDYQDNIYVKRAIKLFSEAYRISENQDEDYRNKKEKEFIYSYAGKIFCEDEPFASENIQEAKDIINDITKLNEVITSSKNEVITSSKNEAVTSSKNEAVTSSKNEVTTVSRFCDLVDSWDIELSLYLSEDPYFNLVKYTLLSALK